MSGSFDTVQFADAVVDPRRVFGTPGSVLSLSELSEADKETILEAWLQQEETLREHSAQVGDKTHRSLADSVQDALRSIRS